MPVNGALQKVMLNYPVTSFEFDYVQDVQPHVYCFSFQAAEVASYNAQVFLSGLHVFVLIVQSADSKWPILSDIV